MEIVDYSKVKIGMIISMENDGSWIGNRIVKYQEMMGFSPGASGQTHIAVSIGGPYIVEATFPKSRVSDLRVDHQGRRLIFLYNKTQIFRDKCRYKFALWCATRVNLPYGVFQLAGFYVKLIWPFGKSNPLASGNTPVCSYLPAWAMRRLGLDCWPGVATGDIVPAHYLSSPCFEIVQVGGEQSGRVGGGCLDGRGGRLDPSGSVEDPIAAGRLPAIGRVMPG